MISRIVGGGVGLILLLAGQGCVVEEPRYCDALKNDDCANLPGHHCNFMKKTCEPNEAGASTADAGEGG